ncbi:MAG: zeta toxin family protein [Gluconacetobacter sp.]
MTRLLIYAGPNGSGKSSLRVSTSAAIEPVDVVIDPDQIARAISPLNLRAADREAGRRAVKLFNASLGAGRSISLETTLAGRSVLRRIREAREVGYHVELRYIALASVEMNIQRVRARAARGGHFIEPEDIRRRYVSSLNNLPAAIALAHRVVVSDNTEARPCPVIEIAEGRVIHRVTPLPVWLIHACPDLSGGG